MRNILFFIIISGCFIINNCLRYLTNDYIKSIQSPLFKFILEFLLKNRLGVSAVIGFILALSAYSGIILEPRREKSRIRERIVRRINAELFEQDLKQHRITLYTEVGYLRAWIHHIYSALYHLIRYPKKFSLYLHWLPVGKYLIIDKRAGLQYPKSTTMFRVEENEERKCQGVIGVIRFQKAAVLVENLPDIQSINLDDVNIRGRRRADTKKVLEYIKKGYLHLKDFTLLKKMNIKARHFYGIVIRNRKADVWGVLLADSTALNSPFDEITRRRFCSFAITLGDML